MKPREFDDLVRQKFDQNDFAYNPGNWDKLAEELDGRAKKRSMIMWLWMPAVGMAASVALAIGVTSLLDFGVPGSNGGAQYAHTGKFVQRHVESREIAMIPFPAPYVETPQPKAGKKINKIAVRPVEKTTYQPGAGIGLRMQNVANAVTMPVPNSAVAVVDDNTPKVKATLPKTEKKAVVVQQVYRTFRDEEAPRVRKQHNFSVILSGGLNQGNRNSGYVAGATVRKMINDKVYVESDVAFAASNNVQTGERTYYEPATPTSNTSTLQGRSSSASKISSADGAKGPIEDPKVAVVKAYDVSYSLYYAQVTPGIGYKLMKRMSVAMGPDFQQMLVDNRPVVSSESTRNNIQVAPTFDVGFVGKTEYALTNRVKAAISYRKGVNGVINPSDKFIDRDYVQFQMRCTIFNR